MKKSANVMSNMKKAFFMLFYLIHSKKSPLYYNEDVCKEKENQIIIELTPLKDYPTYHKKLVLFMFLFSQTNSHNIIPYFHHKFLSLKVFLICYFWRKIFLFLIF